MDFPRPLSGMVDVALEFVPPDRRARDIDNMIKPVSDALVAAGVVSDDSLCESVSAKWADELGGPAVVAIICVAEREMAA